MTLGCSENLRKDHDCYDFEDDHKPWVAEEETKDNNNDNEDKDDCREDVEGGVVIPLVQQLLVHQAIPV